MLYAEPLIEQPILEGQHTAAQYANQVVNAAKLAAWLSPSLLPFFKYALFSLAMPMPELILLRKSLTTRR
jgi:hypothetical protein